MQDFRVALPKHTEQEQDRLRSNTREREALLSADVLAVGHHLHSGQFLRLSESIVCSLSWKLLRQLREICTESYQVEAEMLWKVRWWLGEW